MTKLTFVSDEDVRRHVSFPAVLEAIEGAFIALENQQSTIFPVVSGRGGGTDHFFAIKSARDGSIPALGLKVGSYAHMHRKTALAGFPRTPPPHCSSMTAPGDRLPSSKPTT